MQWLVPILLSDCNDVTDIDKHTVTFDKVDVKIDMIAVM